MIFRQYKTFKIDRLGRIVVNSSGRLKLAHVDDTALPNSSRFHAQLSGGNSVFGQGISLPLPFTTSKEINI